MTLHLGLLPGHRNTDPVNGKFSDENRSLLAIGWLLLSIYKCYYNFIVYWLNFEIEGNGRQGNNNYF